MKQEEFQAAYEKSVAEIAAIRERQTKEFKLIDGAAANVKLLVRPLIYNFSTELKQAVEEAIQATAIDPREVKNDNTKKSLANKLNEKVKNALRHRTDKISQKIQDEIQKGIDKEVERLQDFAQSVGQAITNIEMQFVEVEVSSNRKTSAAAEAITVALSVFTGFGGIWSGYRAAGLKGAAVGAAASFGTAVVAGFIATVIGLPIALPVLLAVGVVSIFTGGGIASMVFAGDLVENYRKNYTEKTLEALDKQIREQRLEQKIDDQITTAFEVLKQTLRQEVDALLDNTQKTLTELSDKRGRQEAMTDAERQEINQIRAETQRILGNAQRLCEQLTEIVSV